MGAEILLFVPNLIGYLRIFLLVCSWMTYYSNVWVSASCYFIQVILDAFDGFAARKLNQTSAFGAWFDIVIDVLGRGMLWCRLYHFGYLVVAIEWIVFTTTHTKGANWKGSFIHTPWFVKAVMANGFKTPMGVIAIGGLHFLPLWLYLHYTDILTSSYLPLIVQYMVIGLLASGRALCAAVEVWCIYSHVLYLCSDEANRPNTQNTSTN